MKTSTGLRVGDIGTCGRDCLICPREDDGMMGGCVWPQGVARALLFETGEIPLSNRR